ncbi:hypothetical protein LTR17_027910, partial [Elasticomyces elasticus]
MEPTPPTPAPHSNFPGSTTAPTPLPATTVSRNTAPASAPPTTTTPTSAPAKRGRGRPKKLASESIAPPTPSPLPKVDPSKDLAGYQAYIEHQAQLKKKQQHRANVREQQAHKSLQELFEQEKESLERDRDERRQQLEKEGNLKPVSQLG